MIGVRIKNDYLLFVFRVYRIVFFSFFVFRELFIWLSAFTDKFILLNSWFCVSNIWLSNLAWFSSTRTILSFPVVFELIELTLVDTISWSNNGTPPVALLLLCTFWEKQSAISRRRVEITSTCSTNLNLLLLAMTDDDETCFCVDNFCNKKNVE